MYPRFDYTLNQVFSNIGIVYLYKEEYNKAKYFFRESIKMNPEFANPYKHIGVVYSRQEKFKKSLEYLGKAF